MSKWVRLSPGNVLAETFRALRQGFLDPYRPELHYMRGPGPKWRERHAYAVVRRPAGIRRVSIVAPPGA